MNIYDVEYQIFPLRAIWTETVEAEDPVSAEAIVLSDKEKQTLDIRIMGVYRLLDENEIE